MKLVVRSAIGAAAAVVAFANAPASAQTTYNTASAFNAAAGPTTLVNLQGCPGGTAVTGSISSSTGPCSGIAAGITFSNPGNNDLYIGPANYTSPTINLAANTPRGAALNISFASLTTSFATELFQNQGGGGQLAAPQSFTLNFLNGATLVNSYTTSVGQFGSFFGITGGSGFNLVTIAEPTGFATVDNVQFGTSSVAAVPEPAAWAMMVLGFGVVGFAMRRWRTVSTTVSCA